MSTLLSAMQSGSQSKLGSQQYPECPINEWSANTNSITSSASNNGQTGNVCLHSPSHHLSCICLTSVVEKGPLGSSFLSFQQCFILFSLHSFLLIAVCVGKREYLKFKSGLSSQMLLNSQKLDLIELFFYYCELNPLTSTSTSTQSTTKNHLFGWLQTHIFFFKLICAFLLQVSCSNSPTVTPSSGSNSSLSPIGPIGRPKCFTNGSLCSESTTSSVSSPTSNYPKAPGFEREDQVHMIVFSSPF